MHNCDVLSLTRQLVDIPSVTGNEKNVGEFLLKYLREQGWECRPQEVEKDRFNIIATHDAPRILLSTHMDTVPPFFPFSEDAEFIYGRGVCDAKGIAAAMICAAGELAEEGQADVGLLFLVGEETDSLGAVKASQAGLKCEYLINGEPTDGDLVIGHKGVVYARLHCHGKAAHSAYPELGESAIEKILDVLQKLRKADLPEDPTLGKTLLNIGTIRAGAASNVVPAEAESELLFRTVTGSEYYVSLLAKAMGERGEVEIVRTSEPQQMEQVEGMPVKVVSFGTDIPALRSIGRPLLVGPGSILDAHTSSEKITKAELIQAVKLYKELVLKLKQQI